MTSLAETLIRYRYLAVCLTIVIVGLLASGGSKLTFDSDYRIFFGEENPQLLAFEEIQAIYTKSDNIMLMLEPQNGDVFDKRVLTAVYELTEQAWLLPYSRRVDSLTNFQHSYAEGDEMTVEDLVLDPAELTNARIEALKQVALNEPLLINNIVSPSGDVTGINITLQLPGIDQGKEVPEVVTPTRALIQAFKEKYPDINVYTSGVVFMNTAFNESSINDFTTLVPLAVLVMVLGVWLYTRSAVSAAVTVVIILFSVMAAMGTAGWFGVKLSPPVMSAPLMILTIAIADSVHFLTTFLQQLRSGKNRFDAIRESLRVNLYPIFLTSLTTALGFLSLNFSDSPPFKDLGNIIAIGVCYAFFLSVLFLPALLAVLPLKPSNKPQLMSVGLSKLAEWVITQKRRLLVAMTALVVVLSSFLVLNELNDEFIKYFDETIAFRTDTDHIADRLTGMYFIDYSLKANGSGGVSNPVFQQQVEHFIKWLGEQPEVRHVNHYLSIMKRINRNMNGDDPSYYRLPEDQNLAAQYLLLYEMSLPYGLDLNNQIDVDKSSTKVTVRFVNLSSNQLIDFEKRAGQWIETNMDNVEYAAASPALMFSHIGKRNINSMLLGTTVALVLISFMLMFALRSWKYGLISLVPNLLPAAVSFGLWGLFVGQVGLGLSIVMGMTLGIVVDDTVHFLSKYLRAKREQGLSANDSVRYAFASVGPAIVVTTFALVGGFLVQAMSSFKLNASMGLLTAITIAIALIIDFLYLPPLLMKYDEQDETEEEKRYVQKKQLQSA